MKTLELQPAQYDSKILLSNILRHFDGAILRGDEGCGKTPIATTIASEYEKVLWVMPAKDIPSTKAKVKGYGLDADIDFISYHRFGNTRKFTRKDYHKYDLMIFDECQNLRNWKASWTKRFVRINSPQFLFLSATPMIKSPRDWLYVLRKCGLWKRMSTADWDIHFMSATPSKYRDGLDRGEFRHGDAFQIEVDKVCVELKNEDIDKDFPPLLVDHHILKGEYVPPKDITQETKTRLSYDLKKVDEAVLYIDKVWRDEGIDTLLVLTYFHEVAQALESHLMGRLALDSKTLSKELKEVKEKGGMLITTFGLTGSQWDFNECDRVVAIGCNYSWAQDRQSFNRCRRFGKTNPVKATYIMFEGERPFVTGQERTSLTERMDLPLLRPSQLAILEKCAGSYWLPPKEDKPSYIHAAALKGTKMHEYFEKYVKNLDKKVPKNLNENVIHAVESARKAAKESSWYYVEKKMKAHSLHPTFEGTADFISYDSKSRYLTIFDYKNGTRDVDPKDNLQLLAYVLLAVTHFKIDPLTIEVAILQKSQIKHALIEGNKIDDIYFRIKSIIDNIMEAKDNPVQHLNPEECSIFCNCRRFKPKSKKKVDKDKES